MFAVNFEVIIILFAFLVKSRLCLFFNCLVVLKAESVFSLVVYYLDFEILCMGILTDVGLLNSGSIISTNSLKLITDEVSLLLLDEVLLKVPILV